MDKMKVRVKKKSFYSCPKDNNILCGASVSCLANKELINPELCIYLKKK